MKKILYTLLLTLCSISFAKETVKIVVPYTAGGTSDILARSLAPLLSNENYNFIVENKPGAGGLVGAELVASEKNEPQLILTGQALVSNVVLGNAKYDLEKDFKHITCVTTVPIGILVKADSPIKTMRDIVEMSKIKSISYGTSGIGTVQSMVSPLIFKDSNQIEVPFKGAPEVLNALLAGTITWQIDNVLLAGPLVDSGKLRFIGVSTKLKKYPDIPTFKELNIDIHNFAVKQLLASNIAVSSKLRTHIDTVLNSEAVSKMYESIGYDSCINTSQPNYLKTERDIIKRLLK